MKVGIIVYSSTGNTLSVAQRLKESLLLLGHSVNLEQLNVVDDKPSSKVIQLVALPDINLYDVIIFASPVRGFSLAPAMKTYLSQISSFQGKKVGAFVTQFFPYPWMGGNRTIEQMEKACEAKGARLFGTGIVNWSHKRERKISSVLEKLSNFDKN